MNIEYIIEQLNRFSLEILTLNDPADESDIILFERKYAIILPEDYKNLLRIYNGVGLFGTNVYGIYQPDRINSLEENFIFEHFQVQNEMPLYLVPFSPDGGGNHYCFDIRFHQENSCPVVFWQHDYNYTDNDPPEVTNSTFLDWVQEVMIDWTLEDYNYDGTPKS